MTRKKAFYILLLFLQTLATVCQAQERTFTQTIASRLDCLMHDPILETSQLGLLVWDLDTDKPLYASGERQTLRPASTMKILTAVTALDRLGEDYTFSTSLYALGEQEGKTFHGDIYIKGGMDPTFCKADIRQMADAMKKLDIDSVCGNVVTDMSFKEPMPLGEGWCWDDKNPTLSALLLERAEMPEGVLHDAFSKAGIIVTGSDSTGLVPHNASLLYRHRTSIEPVLQKMMKESDNLYAEAVFYQTGASRGRTSTAQNAISTEKELLKKIGLNAGDYRIADGSGLSLYNYLSAECEVALLRYAYRNKNIFSTFYQSLPIAGVDGTLKKRMKKTSAYDNVRAKTGTLTGVISLAGYAMSPENHMLAFCIINQSVLQAGKARDFQDKICEAITSAN